MSMLFKGKISSRNILDINANTLGAQISPEDRDRLARYKGFWDFYEGFHWEGIEDSDKPQITENYCRKFIDKFVAYELGKCFTVSLLPEAEPVILPFLNEVWDNMNSKEQFCLEFGQHKAVTGDGWIQVKYIPPTIQKGKETIPNPDFDDPYEEYPKGLIKIIPVSSSIVFPEYDQHDSSRLLKVTIMYPITLPPSILENRTRRVLYKQIWTKDLVEVWQGGDRQGIYTNRYGRIPFFHVKNIPIAGRTYGQSDLEDVIPLNMELNLKKSDISEIIDYHSAPVTVVFGARVGQLERGANKVWGGLPKDAKVENLRLEGELDASVNYVASLKQSMHEVGAVPEGALGKEMAISNTSGVALELQMTPLTERVKMKRAQTSEGLAQVNKFIIKIGIEEGLIIDDNGNPIDISNVPKKALFKNEIIFEDMLPKDGLVELQKLQLEMKLGLCDRKEAMKRLGKRDIQQRLREIDEDRDAYPEIYGLMTALDMEEQTARIDGIKKGTIAGKGSTPKVGGKDIMKRPLNVNKEGEDATVNGGLQNSSDPKIEEP